MTDSNDNPVRILAFSGSARRASYNQRLVSVAAKFAQEAEATVTLIDLADYPLPIFNEDLERDEGTPENAQRLKQLFLDHNGLLIASPEYNSSLSPLLKNTIDWVSRSAAGEPAKYAFLGKTAALLAASPGALGGLRGLVHLRSILSNISVLVLPDQFALSKAHEAFDEENRLVDEKQTARVAGLSRSLVETIAKLNS